jgi:4-hydroxyphenylacetate 3-monooxygenase
MPARGGRDYIARLKEQPPEVWLGGERVKDVTTHPALRNGVHSLAALYDMQHDPILRETMTYRSPTSGDQVGLSFITPETMQDLQRRRDMMAHWARATCGMMGRTPDFLNVSLMAMAAAGEYFAQNRPAFKDHIRRYYEYVREHDLTLTHTLLNMQRSRTPGATPLTDQTDIALSVVRETDAGIVVHGCRLLATLGPLSDEIAVYPARSHHLPNEAAGRYSFAFAIPCSTPGLKLVCRESYDLGRSRFDHPLGSRFEEMDAIAVFDQVLVPWERVFLLGDVERANEMSHATNQYLHSGHQVVTKNVAKAEFIVGLASLMVTTLGSSKLPQVQEKLAELIGCLEVQKACLRAAEADAAIDRWGIVSPALMPIMVARNLFISMYPRMVEIIQLLGSSSLMALPTEADFASPIAADLERYLETDTRTARERAKLFHLAWDVACSAFGGRQALYERFFQGDILRNAVVTTNIYDAQPLMERVRKFLEQE